VSKSQFNPFAYGDLPVAPPATKKDLQDAVDNLAVNLGVLSVGDKTDDPHTDSDQGEQPPPPPPVPSDDSRVNQYNADSVQRKVLLEQIAARADGVTLSPELHDKANATAFFGLVKQTKNTDTPQKLDAEVDELRKGWEHFRIVQQLKGRNVSGRAHVLQLEDELSHSHTEVTSLKQRAEQAEQQSQSLRAELQRVTDEKKEADSAVLKHLDAADANRKTRGRLEKSLHSCWARISQGERDLAEEKHEHRNTKEELQRVRAQLEEHSQALTEEALALCDAKKQLVALDDLSGRRALKLKQAKSKVSALRQEVQSGKKLIAQQAQIIAGNQAQLQELQSLRKEVIALRNVTLREGQWCLKQKRVQKRVRSGEDSGSSSDEKRARGRAR